MPLYRSRAQRFDDLVLEAVAQLEPRWETELAGVEFAVEEIPAADLPDDEPEPVPLARLDPGSPDTGDPKAPPGRPASSCTGGRCWPGPTTRTTWASSCST